MRFTRGWQEDMIHKGLFNIAHQCVDMSFIQTYRRFVRNQWRPYEELKREQEGRLRQMIRFAHENVPYYHTLFRNLNLRPDDIQTIEDLGKLPILTKEEIK